MKVKTRVKAGGLDIGNHNETRVRAHPPVAGTGVKVKTRVKAGGLGVSNHNETRVQDTATQIKAE